MPPAVDINYWAVLVAGIVSMVLGMIWYNPAVFGKPWMALSGLTMEKINEIKKRGMGRYYFMAFIGSLVMAYILAHFVDYVEASRIGDALQLSLWIWLGFVATVMLGSVLWERKSWKLYMINSGFQLVNLFIMSIILVVWP